MLRHAPSDWIRATPKPRFLLLGDACTYHPGLGVRVVGSSPSGRLVIRPVFGSTSAAQVLAEAGDPLNAKEMVERMLAKGLWKTKGRTPQGTLHAAISREIVAKGAASLSAGQRQALVGMLSRSQVG